MIRFWKRTAAKEAGECGLRVATAMLSDTGCHREINEDYVLVVSPLDTAICSKKGILALVADGMGGHEAGEVASRLAAETVKRSYYETSGSAGVALAAAFQEANRKVLKLARRRKNYSGMGTTCTALVLMGELAFAAHVGDSRLYLVRRHGIYQMTEDHTAVMDMVRRGILNTEEAQKHEDRSVLLRALGTHDQLDVSVWTEPLKVMREDRFVLCTDGLHDLVHDDEILRIVESSEPQSACAALVTLARERGGYDNVTVAIVSLKSAPNEDEIELRETRDAEVCK
jgi:protein phosphatase